MFLRSHVVDDLTWEAAQVAHKLCEQQAAEAKWLNKYPYGLPSQEDRELDLRCGIAHAQTMLTQYGEARLLENNLLLKRCPHGRFDRNYGV